MTSDLSDSTEIHALAIIPGAQLSEFYGLAERNRKAIRTWCTIVQMVASHSRVTTGLASAARHYQGEKGLSPGRIRTKYYDWRKSNHDWRTFINYSLEPSADRKQPEAFIEFFKTLCEDDQRTTVGAIVHLRQLWRDGHDVPGYGTWREWYRRAHPGQPYPSFCQSYPKGWHKRNLHRYRPTKFELKATRIGRSAAATERRLTYTTRANLYPGAIYQFDDMWHDLMVNCLRERKPGRPLELFSHDVYSARKARWGFRVRTRNDDGTYNGLAERMTRMILAATLYQDGYSARGTRLVVEHGTAAISSAIEQSITDATGGIITVHRSGMDGAPAHDGIYAGRAKGNFRMKASLESLNGLTHNRFAHLPGQTGKDVPNRPEQLHGMLKHNDALLKAFAQLPASSAELLEFDLLSTTQFFRLATDLYQLIHDRTDHTLEGWGDNIVAEYQLAGLWHHQSQLSALPDAERQLALAHMQAGAIQTRDRRLSPNEVWQRGAGDLIPIHAGLVCDILGPDLASERVIRRQMIEFHDAEVSPDPLRYSAMIADSHGRQNLMPDGEKVLAFSNPFDIEQLFLQDASGRFIGVAKRVHSACQADLDAVHRAIGQARKIETAALAPIRARHSKEAREKTARALNNATVIDGDHSRLSAIAERAIDTTTTNTHTHHDDDDTY